MATARISQAHDKRVQQIAEQAADKIAADSPLEEDVVVVVEELPPDAAPRTQRGRSPRVEHDPADVLLGVVAQGQRFVADGVTRWIEMTTGAFGAPVGTREPFSGFLDPRHLTEEWFRMAEGVLASQKDFLLKVVDAMSAAKAA